MNSDIPGKPVEDIAGALLLDGLLQSFLLGTIVNQVFKYWKEYRDDSWRKRAFVITVIVTSVFQTILEDYKVRRAVVLQRRWSTSRISWSDLLLNGCICALCEGFYIRRCWKMMNKSYWVLAPLTVLSVLIMTANLYLAIAMGLAFRALEGSSDDAAFQTLTASHFLLPSTIVAFSFWIFGSLVLETSVTAILMTSLWRSRTGLTEVDKTVIHIIHITWESAILPSICMVVAVGLYHSAPRMDDHLVLFFVLLTGKLYTFGMLRTLNARGRLREEMQSHDLGRTSLANYQSGEGGSTLVKQKRSNGSSLELSIHLEVCRVRGSGKTEPSDSTETPSSDLCNMVEAISRSTSTATPALDASEQGVFRNRVRSGDVERRNHSKV